MMRAQCCICADLFENSTDISIAAAPCGHTFHEQCLMQWIDKSSTCPSCRIKIKPNQIIKHLYFDIRDDCYDEQDSASLQNENATLKVQIGQLTKAKKDLAEERDVSRVALSIVENEKIESQKSLKDLRSKQRLMQREMDEKEKLVQCYKRELTGHRDVQKKLEGMQHIRDLLTDTEQEINDLLGCYSGGGESSIQQLCQMMGIIKKEYHKIKTDKRHLREEVGTLRGERASYKEDLYKKSKELVCLRKLAEKNDAEIFSLERDNNNKRRKIAHLHSAIRRDKTEGSDSFVAALTEDSPDIAYSPLTDIKQIEEKCEDRDHIPSTGSPDLFEDSFKADKLFTDPIVEMQHKDNISDTTPVLKSKARPFPSASDKFKVNKRVIVEQEKDAPQPFSISNFSIMQKKLTGHSNSRLYGMAKVRGFDGFGCSRKVKTDEPLGPSKNSLLKFGPKKVVLKRNPLMSQGQANKPLPVDQFFSRDISSKSSTASSTKTKSSSSTSLELDLNVSEINHINLNLQKGKCSDSQGAAKMNCLKNFKAKSSSNGSREVVDLTED